MEPFFQPERSLFFSEQTLFYFGVGLICLTILSGLVFERIKKLVDLNLSLQKKLQQLVTIDEESGFDTGNRFALELQLEIERAKRYGDEFNVLLYKIDYLQEFRRLYGQQEYKNFLLHFTNQLHATTRSTDKKFRLSTEEFALILPYVSEKDMAGIPIRLKQIISHYKTSDGKTVSFSNHIAHFTFTKDSEIETASELLSHMRNELKSHVL